MSTFYFLFSKISQQENVSFKTLSTKWERNKFSLLQKYKENIYTENKTRKFASKASFWKVNYLNECKRMKNLLYWLASCFSESLNNLTRGKIKKINTLMWIKNIKKKKMEKNLFKNKKRVMDCDELLEV